MKNSPVHTRQDQQHENSHSYILLLWRADEREASNWHASLEDTSTGERFGFASLEQLFVFLMEQSEKDSSKSSGATDMWRGGE